MLTLKDWFEGLSGNFVSARAAKLLVLAGADKLDTPLMIGRCLSYRVIMI